MEFAEEKRALKPLSCHVGLLRWVKISVMGQGGSMGQQRREPLLFPHKEKGKETMDQKLMVVVRTKLGVWTGARWGCMNPASSRASHVSQQAGSDPVGHGRASLHAWASREHQHSAPWEMKSSACKSGLQVAIMDRNCGKQKHTNMSKTGQMGDIQTN